MPLKQQCHFDRNILTKRHYKVLFCVSIFIYLQRLSRFLPQRLFHQPPQEREEP